MHKTTDIDMQGYVCVFQQELVKASSKASFPAGTNVNTFQSFLLRVRSKENNFNLLFMLFNVTL